MSSPEPSQRDPLRVLLLGNAPADAASSPFPADESDRFVVADLRGRDSDLGSVAELAGRTDVAVVVIGTPGNIGRDLRQAIAVAGLSGVRHLVLAVDAAGGPSDADIDHPASGPLGIPSPVTLPWSAVRGEAGPALLSHLRTLAAEAASADAPFRMPVTGVPDAGLEALAVSGTVASGRVRRGDEIVAAGSGRTARLAAIVGADGERVEAAAGDVVTLHLDRAIGAAPGDVIASAGDRPESCDQFAARLLWFDAEPLLPGRAYRIRVGTREVSGSVTRLKHRIDEGGAAPLAAGTLRAGDMGQVNLSLAEPVVFESFERNRALGIVVLTDPSSMRTVAAGRIDFALRRASNIHRQAVDVTKAARAGANGQRPALLWFTGLSGAGKSTIANLVEKRLFALGHHTYLLDGDNVRHGLNRDLGFTAQDRVENIRRVAETAKLMVDAGLITLASFISPFRAERRLARDLLAEGEFIEVFVDAPLGVAEARDPKGLYAQARAGRIPNFTGIDSPYEAPEAPELHLETDRLSAEELADEVVAHLDRAGFLRPVR